MKILFLTMALLAMTTAQAQSATPTANDAQYQQNIEQVFRGAELDRSIQVYPKAELATWDREKAAGGTVCAIKSRNTSGSSPAFFSA